ALAVEQAARGLDDGVAHAVGRLGVGHGAGHGRRVAGAGDSRRHGEGAPPSKSMRSAPRVTGIVSTAGAGAAPARQRRSSRPVRAKRACGAGGCVDPNGELPTRQVFFHLSRPLPRSTLSPAPTGPYDIFPMPNASSPLRPALGSARRTP